VCGCLTRIERDVVRDALEGVEAWAMIGPDEHDAFDEIVAGPGIAFREVRGNLYKDRYSSRDPRMGLYHVLVSTGCLNQCAYCVIRQAKGTVRSKPLEEILAEVERGLEAGHEDVFLVGDDISSYGTDLGNDAASLLERLSRLSGDGRFSAEAFEPSRFIEQLDALLPSFETGAFSWIVLPVQSGSDRVLRAMGRRYTRGDVERALSRLKRAAPEMIVSTDFIFGFAGETAEEFEASMSLASLFDYANFNEYEQRPGTPPCELPEEELAHRRRAVEALLREQGSQVQVLTRNRSVACDWWKDDGVPMVGSPEPSRWAREHARRIRDALEDRGADLASGWSISRLGEERDRIMLLVVNEGGESMELMLTRRDETGQCMAYSDTYNLTLVSDRAVSGLDAGRMDALRALRDLLGLEAAG
jgi:tRNA A37 methylthiotransferase MiaB